MSLHRTSKDLNSCPSSSSSFSIETKSWQTSQFQCKQRIPLKEFLPKNPPNNPPKKILIKKSSQKITPKKFCQKNFSRNSLEKFPKISKKNSKILKISNSLPPTWRTKPLSSLLLLWYTNHAKILMDTEEITR